MRGQPWLADRSLNDVESHGANTAAVRRVCTSTVYDDKDEEQQVLLPVVGGARATSLMISIKR